MELSIREMLKAGVHFGHQVYRWSPKMDFYVYGEREGIHIIDLRKTLIQTQAAAKFVKKLASEGKNMIFVGTKTQATDIIREEAERCQQFFINKRWLGGTLTNFVTIKSSIDKLKKMDQMKKTGEMEFFSKKERGQMEKKYNKLSSYLGGIRDMKASPQALFVVDIVKEHIAVAEAKCLGIPVVGLADTNSDPGKVDYPIPANDDTIKSISLFAKFIADVYLEGAELYQAKLKEKGKEAASTPSPSHHSPKERLAKNTGAGTGMGANAGKGAGAGASASANTKAGAGARGVGIGRNTGSKRPPVEIIKKQRPKLVAAGLAEEVEIEAELEGTEDKKG